MKRAISNAGDGGTCGPRTPCAGMHIQGIFELPTPVAIKDDAGNVGYQFLTGTSSMKKGARSGKRCFKTATETLYTGTFALVLPSKLP